MQYRIELAATAYVVQSQTVEADSKEEAEAKAKADQNNHEWMYDGLHDGGDISVTKCEPEGSRHG
jgi:hypothetical protein